MPDPNEKYLKYYRKMHVVMLFLLLSSCNSKEIVPIRTSYLAPAIERRAIHSYNKYLSSINIPGFNLSNCPSQEELYENPSNIEIFRTDKNMQYFAATLWQVYSLIEKPVWKEYAQEYSQLLMKININDNCYDDELIRGIFINSFLKNGIQQHRDMILESISRYVVRREESNENSSNSVILNDSCFEKLLENQLLFFATKETGDPLYRHLAIQNSERIYNNQFLNNHSNDLYFGLANWEKLPGLNEMIKFDTQDYYKLAVCFYGFNMLYFETGIIKYRVISERLANFFMQLFEYIQDESLEKMNSRMLIEEKIDLISRIFISLALNDLDNDSEKNYKDLSKKIFNSVLEDLEKADLSDKQKYNFRNFYFLFEYLIRQNSRTSLT